MATQKGKKEKNFLIQGTILAVAGVITKLIGAVYRIPLTNIVGNEGIGYYGVAFSIYIVALTLTSYSLPLAVSKLVSARMAVGEVKNAYRVFKGALAFAILSGGVISLVIFLGADYIATDIMIMKMSVYALRILAPCVLVVALLGVFRGFFQGIGSMIPTAISQVVEQVVNAVASIAGAYVLFRVGADIAKAKGNDSYGPAYAAAGGTIGTILGAGIALLFLILLFLAYKKILRRQMARDIHSRNEHYRAIYKVLLLTITPVVLGATVYNISDFVDSAIFNTVMSAQGYKYTEYAKLLGMFSGQYGTITSVPLAVSTALASSLIPSLVTTVQTGNRRQIHRKITTATRFNMILSIPSAVGLVILAKPILDLLFYTQDNTKPALMLQLGAFSVVLFCLSTVTTSVLQGLDDMITPVKNAAIALVLHVIALLLMLVAFKWNIYAVVLSKTVFAGVICILNAHALRERIGYVQEQKKTFVIPILASAIMAVCTTVVHLLAELFVGDKFATVLALLVAVLTYGVALILLRGITEAEMLEMPKGAMLVKICRKLRLFR
ncbi:putative polysaccharide biosynthesis protein [Suipraeoptans intestinalis]|uniref:putative polysaccharide biosynthesis protein n=1 Tax=Suipraeoptans intestinalis TaxID=2606628 RepID=UPI0023F1CC78|nr:polysaccharide biosynthesis protein [Suipraeoptans intestinalis]MDD7769992.1 polysaccharide biosynthesis protein [Suipraeoptans intestinalis]